MDTDALFRSGNLLQTAGGNDVDIIGAGGRNRTDTGLRPLDFESSASTSFTTPASKRDDYSDAWFAVSMLISMGRGASFDKLRTGGA